MSRTDSYRDKPVPNTQPGEHSSSILRIVLLGPLNLSSALLSAGLSILRPFAPRLVPLVVFSSFIPITVLLSASAGWIVWSNLSVSWEVPLYLQYGDGVTPYAYVQLPTLKPSQRYDISVDFVIPCTDSNLALGNFMTALTLFTSNNKTLTHIRRPAIALPPKSFVFFSKTTRRVKVLLLESFTAPKSKLSATVEVGRHDRWTTLGAGGGREVSVASASLKGLVDPHGIRGIAIRFPLLSSLLSAVIFFTILSLILGSCVLPLVLPDIQDSEDQEESEIKFEPKGREPSLRSASRHQSQEREGRRRRRSRSGKSEGGEESTMIKTEVPEDILLSTAEDSTRGLRRRTSKPAVGSSDTTST